LELPEAPYEMELFAPFKNPTLEPLVASLELEQVAPLEAPSLELTEVSSLEMSEGPLEKKLVAPFETPIFELAPLESVLIAPLEDHSAGAGCTFVICPLGTGAGCSLGGPHIG
jgi:hypothetical protein